MCDMRTHYADVLPHAAQEWLNVIHGFGGDKVTIVEHKTDPEVVHKDWEASHNGQYPPWSTKFIPTVLLVVAGIALLARTLYENQAACLPFGLPQW